MAFTPKLLAEIQPMSGMINNTLHLISSMTVVIAVVINNTFHLATFHVKISMCLFNVGKHCWLDF